MLYFGCTWANLLMTVSQFGGNSKGIFGNLILHVCEPPSAHSYPALVTALHCTGNRTRCDRIPYSTGIRAHRRWRIPHCIPYCPHNMPKIAQYKRGQFLVKRKFTSMSFSSTTLQSTSPCHRNALILSRSGQVYTGLYFTVVTFVFNLTDVSFLPFINYRNNSTTWYSIF